MTGISTHSSNKKISARKLALFDIVPASHTALLLRKHRAMPIWSRKSYICSIKSSYLFWIPVEEQDASMKVSALVSKYGSSVEDVIDLRGCEVRALEPTKKGFPFIIHPKTGKSVTFMAATEIARDVFMSNAIQASKTVTLNDFKITSIIGKGFFGTILAAYRKNDPQKKLFALKEIKLASLRSKSRIATIQGERAILQKVAGSPFLVGLEYAFVTNKALYMVMELLQGGDFLNLMKLSKGRLPHEAVQFYGGQLLLALQHLHSLNIIHRDLKPENILLDKQGNLRVTDLGLSKQLKTADGTSNTFCGTDAYLAPEMLDIDGSRKHGKAVDFWQYGSLIFEMFSGRPPFYKKNISRHEIHEAILYEPTPTSSHVPEEAQSLINALLEKDPSKRLTSWDEVKAHPFFANADWIGLASKKITSPVAGLLSQDYLENFDESLTSIPLRLDPSQPAHYDDFFGFEYVHPDHRDPAEALSASCRALNISKDLPQNRKVVLAMAT